MLSGLACPAPAKAQGPVDVALVLAVDASASVGREEFGLQMDGIAAALRTPDVHRAIRNGTHGAVAITLIEWSGPDQHWQAIPWTRVTDDRSAEALAVEIENTPRLFATGGTAIGAAIRFSLASFADLPWPADRKVIDISGDGSNGQGPPVAPARELAWRQGVTINGLPILSQEKQIDFYYLSVVIVGNGSFIEIASDYNSFADAMTRKLVREIGSNPLLSLLKAE
ncbi:MAG: DUF1194 domain-containing protein [Pseudomonadota bacterium]|nr:DUF1194 domain-containing protein [Pseudomonadota bacterium]